MPVAATAMKPGEKAPDFLLCDERGRLIWSGEILVKGPYVLAFFHGEWCSTCVSWLRNLDTLSSALVELGADVLAVSPETAEYLTALRHDHRVEVKLLSDADYGLASEYGLVVPVSSRLRKSIAADGPDLSLRHGRPDWMLPSCAVFVIDREGYVAASFDVDQPSVTTADAILDVVRTFSSWPRQSRDAAE